MNRILIVDDEQNIVNVLREYAEFEGFLVDCSFDGEQALNRFEKQNYDCVLIDVMMPNLDGFATVKAASSITLCSSIGTEHSASMRLLLSHCLAATIMQGAPSSSTTAKTGCSVLPTITP